MARYVLDIADPSKRKLFDQLLKELDFVEVVNIFKSGKKAQVALEVMESMEDVKAHMAGRKRLKSAKQLLESFRVKYSPVFERAIKRLAKKYPSVRGDFERLIAEPAYRQAGLPKSHAAVRLWVRTATRCAWPSVQKARVGRVVQG